MLIGLMMWYLGFRIQQFSVPFIGSVDIDQSKTKNTNWNNEGDCKLQISR